MRYGGLKGSTDIRVHQGRLSRSREGGPRSPGDRRKRRLPRRWRANNGVVILARPVEDVAVNLFAHG